MGVALLLLFLRVFPGIGLGTTAQVIGQVTFTLSYVVVIVRGRLVVDRARVRGGGRRPRRPAARPALPRPAAAARAGDRRQRRGRVRDLDRRLRRHAVPVERREHDDRVDAALLERARRADPGAQRDRHRRRSSITLLTLTARLPRLPALRRRQRGHLARGTGGLMQGEIRLEELTKAFDEHRGGRRASTSTCRRASSSRCSARPAAGRRRRCA